MLDRVSVNSDGKLVASGLASKIDWQKHINAVADAKKLQADKILKQTSKIDEKISLLGEFSQKLSTFKKTSQLMAGDTSYDHYQDVFAKKVVTLSSSDQTTPSNIATVTAKPLAESGTHTLEVNQVVTTHKLRSKEFLMNENTPLGFSGNMSFSVGGDAPTLISITPDDTGASFASKINYAQSSLKAQLITPTADSFYIVLTSNTMGAAGQISFDMVGSTPALVKDDLEFVLQDESGPAHTLIPAQDAAYVLDGIPMTGTSNIINQAIPGVQINLLKQKPGTEITINIKPDEDAVSEHVTLFHKHLNDLFEFIHLNRRSLSEQERSPLASDWRLPQIEHALRDMIQFKQSFLPAGYQSLWDFGIRADGLDMVTFNEKFHGHREEFMKLMSVQFTSSDPQIKLMGYNHKTQNILPARTLSITADGNAITGAVWDGNFGVVAISGKSLNIVATEAEGMHLLYFGNNDRTIQISYTVGVATKMTFLMNQWLDGTFEKEIKNLEGNKISYIKDYQRKLDRIEHEKTQTAQKFIAMEGKISKSQVALDHLKSIAQKNSKE